MKTIILFSLAAALMASSCQTGPSSDPPKTDTPTVQQGMLLPQRNFWDSLPASTNYTNDFEHILLENERFELDSILHDYEQKTTTQICIVTVDPTATTLGRFDSLATYILDTWGVGQKGKNNGVVILVSKTYRKMYISLGNGLSRYISSQDTKTIIEETFIPEFKKGDYYNGIRKGSAAIIKKLGYNKF